MNFDFVSQMKMAFAFRKSESKAQHDTRIELRRLWDATVNLEQLAMLDDSFQARLALHRGAILFVLRQHSDSAVERLFSDAPSELQGRLVDSVDLLPQLQLGLEGKSDSRETFKSLRVAHQRMLEDCERAETVIRKAKNNLEVALGTLGLLILAVAIYSADQRFSTVGPDLAAGKVRTQSSTWMVCQPEKGLCGGYPTRIAFHTQDEMNPWFQIDLAIETEFSKVWIRNRADTGQIRAIPLIVETSLDGITFTQVARRDEIFSDWTAEFPSQKSRYVRLRVDRKSVLHLEDVRVLK